MRADNKLKKVVERCYQMTNYQASDTFWKMATVEQLFYRSYTSVLNRAVASMYSWGGVSQKFPNDEKNFRIFHGVRSHESVCYPENEDATYKQKYTYCTHRHITEACSAVGSSF